MYAKIIAWGTIFTMVVTTSTAQETGQSALNLVETADALRRRDLLMEARQAYRGSIEMLQPGAHEGLRARAHRGLGWTLHQMHDYGSAKKCSTAALELAPRDLDALKLYGYASRGLGQYDAALKAARTAVSFAATDSDTSRMLAFELWFSGDLEQAARQFQAHQDEANCRGCLGLVRALAGDRQAAKLDFEAANGIARESVYWRLWLVGLGLADKRLIFVPTNNLWLASIARYYRAEISEDELLARARSPYTYEERRRRYCEAYTFLGLLAERDGLFDVAAWRYRQAIETKVYDFLEYAWSVYRLRWLELGAMAIHQPQGRALRARYSSDPALAREGAEAIHTPKPASAFIQFSELLPVQRSGLVQGGSLAGFFHALDAIGGGYLSEEQMRTLLERICVKSDADVCVSGEVWTLPTNLAGAVRNRREVCVGAAFIRADLPCIRRYERDYRLQTALGKDINELLFAYAVAESYHWSDSVGGSFAVIQQFLRSPSGWCGQVPTTIQVYSHRNSEGQPVVDYYSTSGTFHWFRGRDTYYRVRDGRMRFIGYLVITEFGYNVDGCSDSVDEVREDIMLALSAMKAEAERCSGRN